MTTTEEKSAKSLHLLCSLNTKSSHNSIEKAFSKHPLFVPINAVIDFQYILWSVEHACLELLTSHFILD